MSKTIRIPDELADLIDQRRGDVPRERWVRRLIEKEIGLPHTGAPERPTTHPENMRTSRPDRKPLPKETALPKIAPRRS